MLYDYMIPFIENTRKCKLIYSDRREITGGSGAGRAEGIERKDYKGVQGTFGGDRYVHYLCHGDNFLSLYVNQNLSNCTR